MLHSCHVPLFWQMNGKWMDFPVHFLVSNHDKIALEPGCLLATPLRSIYYLICVGFPQYLTHMWNFPLIPPLHNTLVVKQLWESKAYLFQSSDCGGDVPGWYPSNERMRDNVPG